MSEDGIAAFDYAPHLEGELVRLRPLTPADRDPLYAVAADPLMWEVHPSARWQRPVFDAFFDEALAEGGGLIVEDKATGAMIGSSRYSARFAEPGEMEIGWTFLARSHWGGETNRDLKRTMLAHLFDSYDSAIFRVAITNLRSRAAMEKIGGVEVRRWNHATDPKVVEHVVYAIGKGQF